MPHSNETCRRAVPPRYRRRNQAGSTAPALRSRTCASAVSATRACAASGWSVSVLHGLCGRVRSAMSRRTCAPRACRCRDRRRRSCRAPAPTERRGDEQTAWPHTRCCHTAFDDSVPIAAKQETGAAGGGRLQLRQRTSSANARLLNALTSRFRIS